VVVQTPDITIGTELSIGTVVGINKDSVALIYKGNKITASFATIEKVFEDDQNTQANR